MDNDSKGILIGIEGIDAVGKRTQTSFLNTWLRSRGHPVCVISFPDYGTVLGAEIKRFLSGNRNYPPEVRHMLFAANRWEKKNYLDSALSRSDIVIVNRYSESNFAYGIANGLKLEWLVNLEAGLPQTDMVFVLDAPPATLLSRRQRGRDENERNVKLQERTREAYLKLANNFGWNVLNATGGIEETSRLLTNSVSNTFKALTSRTV